MLWNNWLAMAFLVPLLWAIVNTLDIYLVQRIYKSPADGAIISGIIQILPWLALPLGLVDVHFLKSLTPEGIVLGIAGGALFQLACYFYFKAFFIASDLILIQILWNLNITLVPILGFLLLKEQLLTMQYLGIIVVFIGALLLSYESNSYNKSLFLKIFPIMLLAVLFFSLGKIFEARVLQSHSFNFFEIYLLFSLGNFLTGLAFLSVNRATLSLLGNINKLPLFLLTELVSIFATFCTARAISISSTVSFVVMIESFTPAFTLGLSVLIAWWILKQNAHSSLGQVLLAQASHLKLKLASITLMAVGVLLI